MQLVKRENHQDSFLEWHQCPVCRRIEFKAQPVRYELDLTGGIMAGAAQRRAIYS
jgi:hypothetical protein